MYLCVCMCCARLPIALCVLHNMAQHIEQQNLLMLKVALKKIHNTLLATTL